MIHSVEIGASRRSACTNFAATVVPKRTTMASRIRVVLKNCIRALFLGAMRGVSFWEVTTLGYRGGRYLSESLGDGVNHCRNNLLRLGATRTDLESVAAYGAELHNLKDAGTVDPVDLDLG